MASPDIERLRAYQRVFLGPDGEQVLDDLKNAHSIYGPLITPTGPIDPLRLAMAEGERNVVLRIMAILQTKESDYGHTEHASS